MSMYYHDIDPFAFFKFLYKVQLMIIATKRKLGKGTCKKMFRQLYRVRCGIVLIDATATHLL